MVSRNEGYRLGAPKEAEGLHLAAEFLAALARTEVERIEGQEENYLHGDLRLPGGGTVECKRQPIDPFRYPQNFVEVYEETRNPLHAEGFDALATVLGLSPDDLAEVAVHDCRRRAGVLQTTVGRPAGVSISVRSMAGSTLTMYVNPDARMRHVYVYESATLLNQIRAAVRQKGLQRGRGRSNVDTFAVNVPVPRLRWASPTTGTWLYNGPGAEDVAVTDLRRLCGPQAG